MINTSFDTIQFELEPSWKALLEKELTLPYMQNLKVMLAKERYAGIQIYPPEHLIFQAFWKTPLHQVKVVILGQDPYHGYGQAHGLSFSVPHGTQIPPSLVNIYKELHSDLNIPIPTHGCLNEWAEQGVLLLNTVLTVQNEKPLSHRKIGWEKFTDRVIEILAQTKTPLVFILWGKSAESKCKDILSAPQKNHLILIAPHPSPLSAYQGFFGSRPFSKTNEFLSSHGISPIDWGKNIP